MKDYRGEVWVAGEALIDLVLGGKAPVPIVGGGPANTAKALARMEIRTSFIGGISTDGFGDLIYSDLRNSGVSLDYVRRSELPTAIASLTLDDYGNAKYNFKLDSTATFDFGDWLPSGKPDVLHIGTLGTIIEPGASSLFDWANQLESPVVYDPNIRPSILSDRSKYRMSFEKWAKISTIVKLSDDDLDWLGYGTSDLFDLGVSLVVVTKGVNGISAYSKTAEVSVPAREAEVIDTIGAGDTVGAVIIEAMLGNEEFNDKNLKYTLTRAAKAAAITCSRPGANPPTLIELEA